MKRIVATVVAAVAFHASGVCAQSAGLSGKWYGKMGPSSGQQVSVFVDITVAGANVSGRIAGPEITPGTIRKGSYDPKSGAVKFEVAVDGEKTVVNFDGTLVNDSVSGRVTSNTNIVGLFAMGRAQLPNLAPPTSATDTVSMAIKSGFAQVSGWITRAAEMVPAEKYSYRPVATVRTYGEVVAHVVDGYAYYCGRGAGNNAQWSDATAKGKVDKATLAAKLKAATDACTAAYANPKMLPPLLENIAHANLHYGNIVTYMRMLGLVPPSS